MKNIILITIMAITLSGCSLLGGNSDYDSHTKARVEFKQSDDSRIVYQSASIAGVAAKDSGSAEAAAYKNALAMISIAILKNQDYGEVPPMTWAQVGGKVVDAVPFVSSTAGLTYLGVKATQAAGNVEIGENATVSGSLNRPSATSIGDGATATMQPYEVRPEIVEPTAVK